MPHIDTRAGRVAYSDTGVDAGSLTVVLLHASLHDRHDFDAIAPRLADRYRVIAVDWPGHGESGRPAVPVTAAVLADTLEEVVEGLGLASAVFIGNSVGGFAAARLAIRRPSHVAGLVLVNVGGFTPQNAVAGALISNLLGRPAISRRIFPWWVSSYMKPKNDLDRAVRDRAVAVGRTREGSEISASLWRSFVTSEHDLRAEASSLHAPTLLVWGSRDTALPLPFGHLTRRRLPRAQFETLPTGHVVFASAPDEFLSLVEPFIDNLVPSPGADR